MKKILFLLALVFAHIVAAAAPINEEQARRIATQFFSRATTRATTPSVELVWDGEAANTRSATAPALYVFNRTDRAGFVIVAGDEAATPIIGYSHQNHFADDNLPANLRWWLDGVRSMILEARAKGVTATASSDVATASTVCLHTTATWDQGAPYNGQCPYLSNGSQTITGCVATAASILCKFHEWPTSMSGTTAAYTTTTHRITVPSRTLGSYDYSLMPLAYSNYTSTQAEEVARLMADIGALVQADYGIGSQGDGGTGALTENLLKAFHEKMGYSKQAILRQRLAYSDSEWKAMLKAELDAARLIIYGGTGNAGGHQFICDGYDSEDYFHFNWGWSGHGNGFYSLQVMAPSGTSYSFVEEQDAIIGLEPDRTGSSTYNDWLGLIGVNNGGSNYYGISSNATRYETGVSITYYIGGIQNFGTQPFTGSFKIVHCDKNGAVKKDLKQFNVNNLQPLYYTSLKQAITLTETIEEGDRLRILYKGAYSSDWQWAQKINEQAVSELVLVLTPEEVAAQLHLLYAKTSNLFTFSAPYALQYTVTRVADNTTVAEGAVAARTDASIDTSNFEPGEYRFSFASGSRPYELIVQF